MMRQKMRKSKRLTTHVSHYSQLRRKVCKRQRLTTKPSPTSWFDLPLEMREIVIDKMDAKTRCRFAQCSKICEEEAKKSKNYLKKIGINTNMHGELFIGHTKDFYDYCLEFIEFGDESETESIVIYKTVSENVHSASRNMKCTVKWMKTESGQADEVRIRYLNKYVKDYGKAITELEINDDELEEECCLKQLKNLNSIKGNVDDDVLKEGFLDLTQILRANQVNLRRTIFSFDQILQFKGSRIVVKSDEFDENNILKFLKMVKNGEVDENLKKLNVFFKNRKNFDGQNIINGLDVHNYEEEEDRLYITFNFNLKKYENSFAAVLYWSDSFSVSIIKKGEYGDDSKESEMSSIESTSDSDSASDGEFSDDQWESSDSSDSSDF